jgi:hypothetical protein
MTKIYRKTDTVKAEQFDGSNDMINKYPIEFDEEAQHDTRTD